LIRTAIRAALCALIAVSATVATARADVSVDSAMVAAPFDTIGDWGSVPEYRIVPGDILTLDFGPRADLNGDVLREVTVRPDGRISVFPVGDVVAAGHSPHELEGALVRLLAGDIRAPRVTVELTKMAANMVHVLGAVEHSGPVPADPYMTVVQAITAAGGFKDGAARNSVIVFSRNGANTVKVTRVSVDDQLKYKGLVGDLRLSRFDVVYVPRSFVGNLDAFSRQFFGGLFTGTEAAISGWELFHLDRVFFVPSR
jgi:polysaccharide export outer membrane protein